jgi:hypothetical protein
VLVHQRVKNLLAQPGNFVPVGLEGARDTGPFEGTDDFNGITENVELEAKVPVLRVAALQRQKAEFANRQAQILQLFDVEPGTSGYCARDQAGEHDQIAPRRKPQLDPRIVKIFEITGLSSTRSPLSSRSVVSVTPLPPIPTSRRW